MRKRIGIVCTQKQHPESNKKFMIGLEMPYLQFFSQLGNVIPILPHHTPDDLKLDLLICPGGADLDPSFYGKEGELVVGCGSANPMFSQFYEHSFDAWRKAKTPTLGICLGFQAINVKLGGGLTADGPNHSLSFYDRHPIAVYSEKLKLYKTFNKAKRPFKMKVNSRHHQFVRPHQLADGLIPVAVGVINDSDLDNDNDAYKLWGGGNNPRLLEYMYNREFGKIEPNLSHIEAAIHASEKIACVQWHPEDMWNTDFTKGDRVTKAILAWLLEEPATVESSPKGNLPRKYLKQEV